MKTIYKYQVGFGRTYVSLPDGFKIVLFARQNEQLYLWAEFETEQPTRARVFQVSPTGVPVPQGMKHWLSMLDTDGFHVWHLYEDLTG